MSRQTGDKGWVVRRNGRVCVKLNRPSCDSTRPYHQAHWREDVLHREFSAHQVAQVAFEADKALCRLVGEHEKSKREWKALGDKRRNLWATEGPKKPKLRADMYRLIKGLLGGVENIQ